jgi:uncharacterized membrane protein YjgN (DUF898 family)
LIGVRLAIALGSFVTLGLAYPALFCFERRWYYSHTVINGYRLKFTGTGMQIFGKHLLWSLLTLLTLGIYSFWIPIKYQKWETKHVRFDARVL